MPTCTGVKRVERRRMKELSEGVGTNAAFKCGGIDGKLGGLTPMNSYARLVCIRGIKTTVIGLSR